jgi:hypothetical protein
VGDTVGDPFKDTSGPSLNILIKLMSMISLTIATLMEGKEDWEEWYWGLIPLFVMLAGSFAVYHYFWKEVADISAPMGGAKDIEEKGAAEPEVGVEAPEGS